MTLSKYVVDRINSVSARSAGFCFAAEYLTDAETAPVYKVYTDSVDFSVKNTGGLNTSNTNIIYNISATKAALSKGNESRAGFADERLLLNGGAVTYTFSGSYGDTVSVTATSTSPYKKILSAVFVLENPERLL